MAKIPFLHPRRHKDGTVAWHWKPSPKWRALGFVNQALGTNRAAAFQRAIELNDQLLQSPQAAAERRAVYTFGDCVDAYRAADEYAKLADATKREYDGRLRWLQDWALAGRLPLKSIDKAMVRDLRTELLKPLPDGAKASPHVAAATLRVLRLLLNWAVEYDHMPVNPAMAVKIPQPPARAALLLPADVDLADAAARELGWPAVALGFAAGLWFLQREGDMLRLNRMGYRPIENVDPADAAVLANRKGDVMGFRLRQQKTGAWVDCPVPPQLHDRIDEALKRSQWLLPDDNRLDRACPQYLFQRRVRKALDKAGLQAFEYRDLRRSGMSMMRDLGVADPTPISGHAILGKKSILDTYMPGSTRAACAAMATALRTLAARQHKDEAK